MNEKEPKEDIMDFDDALDDALSSSKVYARSKKNKEKMINLIAQIPVMSWGKLHMQHQNDTIGMSYQERMGFREWTSKILIDYSENKLKYVEIDEYKLQQEKAMREL